MDVMPLPLKRGGIWNRRHSQHGRIVFKQPHPQFRIKMGERAFLLGEKLYLISKPLSIFN